MNIKTSHNKMGWIERLVFQSLPLLIFSALFLCSSHSVCGGQFKEASEKQVQALQPGDHERKIQVNGRKRIYFVHVPTSYKKDRPAPVVLNLHGGGGTPKAQRNASRMDNISNREGFVVVYPQGTNRRGKIIGGYTWNAGTCCGWAQEHNIDDVAFISALLDDLEKVIRVDKKRIYATGLSNGAMMCYRLACELSDRVAAIAPVSGPMQMKDCRPSRPVPVIHFHGTEDPFVPMKGGKGPRSLPDQSFASVEETMDFWVKANGLSGKKPNIIQKGKATGISHGPGKNGAEVVLWKLQGGGHTWPGGKFGFLKERTLGRMIMDISASELMWKFFEQHPLP